MSSQTTPTGHAPGSCKEKLEDMNKKMSLMTYAQFQVKIDEKDTTHMTNFSSLEQFLIKTQTNNQIIQY